MLFTRVSRLRDAAVLSGIKPLLATEATATAELLARLVVIEQRRLFAAAGYPSMYAYCVHELGLSEDAALRRLNASRLAATRPEFFDALADRRLTLSSLLLLTSYVAAAPATELVAGLAHKSLAQAREWLAHRFPQQAIGLRMQFVARDGSRTEVSAGTTLATDDGCALGQVALTRPVLSGSSGITESEGPLPSTRTWPLSAEYVAYQFSARRRTHELMQRAWELLGHETSGRDVDAVIARGLELLVRELEKRKHGLHTEVQSTPADSTNTRHIPRPFVRRFSNATGGSAHS